MCRCCLVEPCGNIILLLESCGNIANPALRILSPLNAIAHCMSLLEFARRAAAHSSDPPPFARRLAVWRVSPILLPASPTISLLHPCTSRAALPSSPPSHHSRHLCPSRLMASAEGPRLLQQQLLLPQQLPQRVVPSSRDHQRGCRRPPPRAILKGKGSSLRCEVQCRGLALPATRLAHLASS